MSSGWLMAKRSRAGASPSPSLAPAMTTTFSWMLLLIVKLNRDFHRAGAVQRSDARICLPDDDYAGVRNLLAIVPIEDGDVRTRRPINHLANFVSMGSFSLFPNPTRQLGKFFSAW